ncbi:DUF72 domain-containing protein [Kineococcus sp. R8]|uniref:DUF72 domain-containing protein n=1 Tax=Kineococcus siccus TaxID=2696567 RepID=UPI00141329C3|nr:DUF72 domain-containing protein [Kineococcus siccus]
MSVFVGTSGWSYDHWAGVLYPPRTPPVRRLEHYLREFRTVELNTSFYRWPAPATFATWRAQLPAGFRLSVKASRYLTHYRRLGSPEPWVERMVAGWRELGDVAAVLLLQLRGDQDAAPDRLEHVLDLLPADVRTALEPRHAGWDSDDVARVLARHGAATCLADGAGVPALQRDTAPFRYVRLHGPAREPLYAGGYTDEELAGWAQRFAAWHDAGQDVHVYFNNDIGGHAVRNARTLCALLGPDVAPTA